MEEANKTLSPYFFVKSDDPRVDQLPLKSTSADVKVVGVIADVTVKIFPRAEVYPKKRFKRYLDSRSNQLKHAIKRLWRKSPISRAKQLSDW
jgi:hypothetical protein